MTEQIRENYFLTVKTFFVLFIEIYLLLIRQAQAGISGGIFLLMALFFGLFIGQALTEKKGFRMFFLLVATGELVLLVFWYGKMFLLPGVLLGYEIVSALRHWRKEHGSVLWYALPLLFTVPFCAGNSNWYFVIALFVGIIYLQHDFIVTSYRVQMRENTISEQHLKKDLNEREHALHEELKRGLLGAENQVLEERANLSQMLHDKLGHSINGSVYQLEAAKLLIQKDPETTEKILKEVIDQLRRGMDEIRAILRRERPPRYKLAMLQLERLCEECRSMDIKAKVNTEGDLSAVPEKYLEIILDNAVEAVSNALKYAHCTKIEIKLVVMNQMLRRCISDNGIGCSNITDGMGISGMRKRVRGVNGIIDFQTEAGFTINMLLPM